MTAQTEIDALLAQTERLVTETHKQVGGADATSPPSATRASRLHPGTPPAPVERVLNIEVPIIVVLAERPMRFRDVLSLTAGSILEFEKPAEADLVLMINNKCIGTGKAVKVGENFGLTIRAIESPQTRIAAMAGGVEGRSQR
jgi:flagellar motor switch protein FliN/FliY